MSEKRWGQYEKSLFNAHTNERYGKLADRMTLRQKFLLNSLYGKMIHGKHKHAYVLVDVNPTHNEVGFHWDHHFSFYKFTCTKCGRTIEIMRGLFWDSVLKLYRDEQ